MSKEGLFIHIMHGSVVDVVPDPGKTQSCGKRIVGLLDLLPHTGFHLKDQVIVPALYVGVFVKPSEHSLIDLFDPIDENSGGILLASPFYDVLYLRKVILIRAFLYLMVIQAACTFFSNFHGQTSIHPFFSLTKTL